MPLVIPNVRLAPGAELGGFRVKYLLGVGGMGEVYLAEQTALQRDVALKILPPEFGADPAAVQQFLTEVRTMAQLNHPTIVHAYAGGEAHGLYYFAMQYVPGQSLLEKLL